MNLWKKYKIRRLKKEASDAQQTMWAIQGAYNCGIDLMKTFSSNYNTAEARYNEAMRKLKLLDPDFPA